MFALDYAPDEVLVRFKPGVSERGAAALHASHKWLVTKKIPRARVHRVKLPKGVSVEQAIAAYRRSPLVDYAGPNHIMRLDSMYLPNDEHFEFWQWALYDGGARHDIHAPEAWGAWDQNSGASVTIAVLDTGVWAVHEDLYAPGPNPKVLVGYNTVLNNTETMDYNGHGTLVASIAAAITDNWIGMAGVAWNAKILPVKVMEGEIGYEIDAAEGVYWAADHDAKIINMSLGTYIDEPILEQAIDYAWNTGCLIVCSSGNDDLNAMHYPSAYDHALAVGGTDEQDARWVYDDPWFGDHYGSNYGAWLDVMAPASMILGAYTEEDWLLGLGYYTIASGTSASSPHVSGIAALIWSKNPTWTNEQVFQQIIACCDNLGPAGWDIETGYGRVNAEKALTLQSASPATISEMKNLANGTRVTLTGKVVTCSPGLLTDRIYIEDPDESSGILVYGTVGPPAMVEGSRVDVTGTLGEFDGERALTNAIFSNVQSGLPLDALSIPGRDFGGKQMGLYQMGVDKGRGLNNLGLLVRCSGLVTWTDFTYFYIDDGSNLRDGSGHTGLRVTWNADKPDVGRRAVVTGMSGCFIPDGTSLRVRTLRVRNSADLWPPL
ncbi:MAG: S8 family serine peptidase [Armatimonadota bacterium]|nr:S8 family serine peptidase [Armatimonadota bacterium]